MQHAIWGKSFTEVVPATILKVTQQIGGVTAGAFDASDRLLGFVFGMTGVQGDNLVHWSDLLAVHPDARNGGLGERLKHYQRDLLVPLGVKTMFWTYDPLVAKNAYLNIVKLGARPAEYIVNMYGSATQSALHGALGTDRFVVAWDLTSKGHSAEGFPSELDDPDVVRVEIPADIEQMIATDFDAAMRLRESTRQAFTSYMAGGYQVIGFSHSMPGDRYSYLLSKSSA